MLHWLMGDAAFRAAMRQYYADNHLQHVTESDLRAAVNAHSAENLDWFFDQWIHTTATLDYSIGEVSTQQGTDGRWTSHVEVIREGDIRMPVELQVGEHTQRLTSHDRRQHVVVTTAARPDAAILDPDSVLIDLDPANNTRPFPR